MPIVAEMKFKECQKLIYTAFPAASSRRMVPIKLQETYTVHDYWDGGSRTESRFVNILDVFGFRNLSRQDLGAFAGKNQTQGNPYNQDIYTVTMQDHFAVVEHVIFQGKDLGYRIILHPSLADTYQRRIIDT